MQYLYIGIIIILFLSIEKKWVSIGQQLQKIKNIYLISGFILINLTLLFLQVRIHNQITYFVLITILLAEGFVFLCKRYAKKFAQEQKEKLTKKSKKAKAKLKLNETKNKENNKKDFLTNYAKPLLSVVVLYIYLYFQNQVHLSKSNATLIINTLLQYGMQIVLFLLITITMIKTFVKHKLNVRAYNIVYIMYILFALSFVFDSLLALIFSKNPTFTLNIFNNGDVLTTIVILLGVCNSICLYTLVIFDFVVWKKLVRSN